MKKLTSLLNALERKVNEIDDTKKRSIETTKLGIRELRTLTDFIEISIFREIEESFEIKQIYRCFETFDKC